MPDGVEGKSYCCSVEPAPGDATIEVVRTIAVTRQGRIPVRVHNLSTQPLRMHRYQKLAEVYFVDNEDVEDGEGLQLVQEEPDIIEVNLCQQELI